jgi:hypothetical protein
VDAGTELYAYTREAEGVRLLVVLNFSSSAQKVLGAARELGSGHLEVSTDPGRKNASVELGDVELQENEGVILRL